MALTATAHDTQTTVHAESTDKFLADMLGLAKVIAAGYEKLLEEHTSELYRSPKEWSWRKRIRKLRLEDKLTDIQLNNHMEYWQRRIAQVTSFQGKPLNARAQNNVCVCLRLPPVSPRQAI